MSELVLTRLRSHRCNDKARNVLGFAPRCYFTFASGYFWWLRPDDLDRLRDLGYRRARIDPKLVSRCWSSGLAVDRTGRRPAQPYETP